MSPALRAPAGLRTCHRVWHKCAAPSAGDGSETARADHAQRTRSRHRAGERTPRQANPVGPPRTTANPVGRPSTTANQYVNKNININININIVGRLQTTARHRDPQPNLASAPRADRGYRGDSFQNESTSVSRSYPSAEIAPALSASRAPPDVGRSIHRAAITRKMWP